MVDYVFAGVATLQGAGAAETIALADNHAHLRGELPGRTQHSFTKHQNKPGDYLEQFVCDYDMCIPSTCSVCSAEPGIQTCLTDGDRHDSAIDFILAPAHLLGACSEAGVARGFDITLKTVDHLAVYTKISIAKKEGHP